MLRSDVFDLLKWYNTFTSKPEVIGLSKQSLAALLEPLTHMPIDIANASFAQGIVVEPLSSQVKKVNRSFLACPRSTHLFLFCWAIEKWICDSLMPFDSFPKNMQALPMSAKICQYLLVELQCLC